MKLFRPAVSQQKVVDRVTSGAGDEEQNNTAGHGNVFPKIAALDLDVARIGESPITMRTECRDDHEKDQHQCGIACRESEQDKEAAEEFDRRSDVAEEIRQIAPRHRFDERL